MDGEEAVEVEALVVGEGEGEAMEEPEDTVSQWDIMIQLLELNDSGIETLTNSGIESIGDVELFGTGATADPAPFTGTPFEGFNLVTQQKFLVVATYLLNDGVLTPELTLAEMARANKEVMLANMEVVVEPEPPVKRGVGRPRKDGSSPSPKKRGVGRPRKDGSSPSPKKRGRPRKNPVAEKTVPVKRGRGRPRKIPVAEVVSDAPKRGVGRPRKNPLPESPPPKAVLQRGRGRPRKSPGTDESAAAGAYSPPPAKRGPGRPRKYPIEASPAPATSPPGSPPVKRGRGRPRKYPRPEDSAPEVMETEAAVAPAEEAEAVPAPEVEPMAEGTTPAEAVPEEEAVAVPNVTTNDEAQSAEEPEPEIISM